MKIIFWLLFISLLILRIYTFFTLPKPFGEGDEVRITTRIYSEPVQYEDKQYLRIEGLKVYLPLYPTVSYGDRVVVTGKVAGDHLKGSRLVLLDRETSGIYQLRNTIIGFFEKSLPPPHSSLVSGMVLGSKSGISGDFWDKLKKTGTAHVVVASGMNISLISGFLINFFLLFCKRNKAVFVTGIGIWFYVLLSGFDAPILRAAIMASVSFLAQLSGRLSQTVRILVITGFLMLIVNPGYLQDVGFLLSFFATLSLIILSGWINRLLHFLPKGIKENLSTSISAQIGVSPILYYYFGSFNPLSPFINLLILWCLVPVTLIGMVSGIVGVVFEPLGRIILYLAYPMTFWFVKVIYYFG